MHLSFYCHRTVSLNIQLTQCRPIARHATAMLIVITITVQAIFLAEFDDRLCNIADHKRIFTIRFLYSQPIYLHMYLHWLCIYTKLHINTQCVYTHTYIYIYIYTYMTYMFVCLYLVYICIYMQIHTHVYSMYIYIR